MQEREMSILPLKLVGSQALTQEYDHEILATKGLKKDEQMLLAQRASMDSLISSLGLRNSWKNSLGGTWPHPNFLAIMFGW
jgi:hypothetical protein